MGQASRTLRNLTNWFWQFNANHEPIADASVERNDFSELEADPIVTQAEIVRIIHYYIMIYKIFSPINPNPLLKLVELIKRLLYLMLLLMDWLVFDLTYEC